MVRDIVKVTYLVLYVEIEKNGIKMVFVIENVTYLLLLMDLRNYGI